MIQDNKLMGDNRSDENLDAVYSNFVHSSDFLWGKGSNFARDNNLLGNSSYKLFLLNYGLVFVIVLILAFFLLASFNITKKKYLFIYMVLFLGLFYQRPGMLYYQGAFFLWIACIYAIKQNTDEESETEEETLPELPENLTKEIEKA